MMIPKELTEETLINGVQNKTMAKIKTFKNKTTIFGVLKGRVIYKWKFFCN